MPDQDYNLDDLIPLLTQQKQDTDLQAQHNAAAKFLGNAVAPGLTSYFTSSASKEPNIPSDYVGKVPSSEGPNPIGAISDVAGWFAPEVKAGLAAKAASSKLGPSLAALFLSNPTSYWNGVREHRIFNDALDTVGKMSVQPIGSDLFVHGIEGLGGVEKAKNKLGTSEMRTLLNALKEEYPDAETISGYRVTGMRHGSAGSLTGDEELPLTTVRIRPPFEQRQEEEVNRLVNDPVMQEIVKRHMANIKL